MPFLRFDIVEQESANHDIPHVSEVVDRVIAEASALFRKFAPLPVAAQHTGLIPLTAQKRTISMSARQSSSLLEGPLVLYLAPTFALIYPATLWSFHVSVSAFESAERGATAAAAAVASLVLSFVFP